VSAPADVLAALKTLQDYVVGVQSVELPPRPGHYVTEDPPLSCTCLATMFGLNWNGTIDQSDNGEGFFIDPATKKPFETRDQKLVGASLPREVMLSTFGISDDWRSKNITEVWLENAAKVQEFVSANNPLLTVDSGGHTLRDARLVDAGPAAGTNNGLDLTYNSAHLLDTQGKALVTYKIVIAGQPVPIKGWLFDKRRVG
jgi:hypothetical protein